MNPTSETPLPDPQAIPSSSPPPLDPPLPDQPDIRTLVEALLRRPHALVVHLGRSDQGAALTFGALALGSFLLFGLVLGCFAKHEQLYAAPLKIATGLLISGAICFPSLYIFTTLAGGRVSLGQLAASLAGSLALAGLLLLGFAPAIWIFAESTDSFGFMGVLAVGSWLVAFTFALRFLRTMAMMSGGTQAGPLRIWSFVFLLVTLQMTTSLRPILGRSDDFLTSEKKFFLQHWSEYFGKSLPKPADPTPKS
jgi:hypothetical protein